ASHGVSGAVMSIDARRPEGGQFRRTDTPSTFHPPTPELKTRRPASAKEPRVCDRLAPEPSTDRPAFSDRSPNRAEACHRGDQLIGIFGRSDSTIISSGPV